MSTTYGVIWTALAGSGHLASFDRRKCRVLSGPAATTAQHCPEGWTLYRTPGPSFKGATDAIPVDMHYYNFVDSSTRSVSDRTCRSRTAPTPTRCSRCCPTAVGSCCACRIPSAFFSRGMDGRIDDPNGGWKGRALYADYGQNAVWHIEGGKGTRSSADQVSTASRSACQVNA